MSVIPTATTVGSEVPEITFSVDPVEPAQKPMKTWPVHKALRLEKQDRMIESCSDYHTQVVQFAAGLNGLISSVFVAHSDHRPLAISPDVVWLTIAHGVANHMTFFGEELRHKFVDHQDRISLAFQCTDWVPNSPENPWSEAFEKWTDQIRGFVGEEVYDTLICDFSTSGPVERAASQIVMMDVFKKYFRYQVYAICGIPEITLKGTPGDWIQLRNKVEGLQIFEMEWWLSHLRIICDQFVDASQGKVDLKHWQNICKQKEKYGGYLLNGWIVKLIPYLQDGQRGPGKIRNPVLESDRHEGICTSTISSGLSSVPFSWIDLQRGTTRLMHAIGGIVGVTQCPQSLRLEAIAGWGIREGSKTPGSTTNGRVSTPSHFSGSDHDWGG